MKTLCKARYKIPDKVKEYLLTTIIFLFILFISAIPDYIYYHTNLWMSGNPFGLFCIYLWKKGFTYKGALRTLNNNFGILVTAISVIITMSVNNLNRSENKFFGLRREQFTFSKRQVVYQYGRRMILFAPLVMIMAVIIKYCIAGYTILILSYFFLIIAYFLFESSFSREKDLECIVTKLSVSLPQTIRDAEDITDYLMLLSTMRQWNESEKYWEGVHYLFRRFDIQIEEYDIKRMYALYYYFYEVMYIQDNKKDYDKAVYALKDYITRKDREGWKQDDYLILWGMMDCLFERCSRDSVVQFIKWYMDISSRSCYMVREYGHTINMSVIRRQIGIMLIEMELFFHRYKNIKKIDNYIWEKLSQIWNEGKILLDEKEKKFRQQYLDINAMYKLNTREVEERLKNLISDYQYNTTRSLLVYYLKYKQQEGTDGRYM